MNRFQFKWPNNSLEGKAQWFVSNEFQNRLEHFLDAVTNDQLR